MKKIKVFFILLLGWLKCYAQVQTADTIASVKEVRVNEVEVVAPIVSQTASSTTYLVTPKMRDKSEHIFDLLTNLPTVSYSELDNSLKVNGETNILLLVNGTRYPINYIAGLSLDEVTMMEVQYLPATKYTSEGYKYVIDIKTLRQIGYGIFAKNLMMVSPNNGKNSIANEQPFVQYRFARNNFGLFFNYGFADIHWNYPISIATKLYDSPLWKSAKVTTKNPNEKYENRSHTLGLGASVELAENHTLVAQTNVNYEHLKEQTSFAFSDENKVNSYKESIEEKKKIKDFSATLFYNGTIGEQLEIEAGFGYNRIAGDMYNSYEEGTVNQKLNYDLAKHLWKSKLDLTYYLNETNELNLGVNYTALNYLTKGINSNMSLYEKRLSFYTSWGWRPWEELMINIGGKMEQYSVGNVLLNKWNFLPQVMIGYMPTEMLNLSINYETELGYPTALQRIKPRFFVNKYADYQSNPYLLTTPAHSISLQANMGEQLVVGGNYTFNANESTEAYLELATRDKVEKGLVNAKQANLTLFAGYEWEINDKLSWKNILQYSNRIIKHKTIGERRKQNFTIESEFKYLIPTYHSAISLGYLRNLIEEPLLQGSEDYGLDYWQVSLHKSFFKRKLSVSLNYIPPVHFGVRKEQKTEIKTEAYLYQKIQNLNTYDNLLMLRLQFHFNKGKQRQERKYDISFDKENYSKNKGLM